MRFKRSSLIFVKIVPCLIVEIDYKVILHNTEYFQSASCFSNKNKELMLALSQFVRFEIVKLTI